MYLDEYDRKMALLRNGRKIVELAECGVALERRFTFYDQVHTTGMDIEQLLNAHAVLTLGKDMVFRDFAQGAFRLRKIGQGQRLTLFVIPEVMQLIGSHVARCRRQSVADYSRAFSALPPNEQWAQMLKDVVAWLLDQLDHLERAQFKLLCEQNLVVGLAEARRTRTCSRVGAAAAADGARNARMQAAGAAYDHGGSDDSPEVLKLSVGVFREGVDFSVENAVRRVFDFVQRLTQRSPTSTSSARATPSAWPSPTSSRSSPGRLSASTRARRSRRRTRRCRSGRWRGCSRIRRRTTAISRSWRATRCG